MPRLAANVVLRNPETRDRAVLLAGTDAPAWAVPLITNPEAWETAPDVDEKPSRPHGNASRATWAAYAQQVGLTDLDGLTRDDIRALVDEQ